MGSATEQMIDDHNAAYDRKLAKYFGISQHEFEAYEPEFHETENGEPYYQFPEETPDEVKAKIKGIDSSNCVYLTQGELNEIDKMPDPGVEKDPDSEEHRDQLKLDFSDDEPA